MPKRLTKEEILRRFNEKYPDKIDNYDFSDFEYKGYHTKGLIHCRKCGMDFEADPAHLLGGHGCKHCKTLKLKELYKKPLEKVIEEANKAHNNFYSYDKTVYVNNKTPMVVTCPIHGDFLTIPTNHIFYKEGCPKCGGTMRKTLDEFIENAKKVHGDLYDYSLITEYVNRETEVPIKCNTCGNIFYQKPYKHVNAKHGCTYCIRSELEKRVGIKLEENYEVECQKKFTWLGRMSLDYYLPQLNVAIECQGIQHFKPTSFKGSHTIEEMNENLINLQERDVLKYNLCKENGVDLLYFINEEDLEILTEFYNDKLIFFNTKDLINFLKEDYRK